MKTLRTVLLTTSTLCGFLAVAALSHAAPTWFTVRIDKAGPVSPGQVFVSLSDVAGSFSNRWFVADEPIKNQILATALTAIATEKRALVLVSDPAAMSTILRFYLNKNVE